MNPASIINRYSMAGAGATFIGVGLGRFAYIALLPIVIQAGWFTESEATYLSATTLLGYILGAPLSTWLIRFMPSGYVIRMAMLLCSLSYLLCAWDSLPIQWFYSWRFIAGASGAILMIVVPPFIMRRHISTKKSKVSGVIFSGLGLGVVLSGFIVPLLFVYGVDAIWLGVGFSGLLMTAITWRSWQVTSESSASLYIDGSLTCLSQSKKITLIFISIAYAFDALGYLPHTLFWVDFIVRELDMPVHYGGLFWAVFGIGAIIGPLISGAVADRFSVQKTLVAVLLIKATAVLLPALNTHSLTLMVSAFFVGVGTPAVVSLVSSYTLENAGYELHTKAWGVMTFSFALSQALFGYFFVYFSLQLSSYIPLFIVGSIALMLASLCIYVSQSTRKSHPVKAAQ